jgi:hypothetical protein
MKAENRQYGNKVIGTVLIVNSDIEELGWNSEFQKVEEQKNGKNSLNLHTI